MLFPQLLSPNMSDTDTDTDNDTSIEAHPQNS